MLGIGRNAGMLEFRIDQSRVFEVKKNFDHLRNLSSDLFGDR